MVDSNQLYDNGQPVKRKVDNERSAEYPFQSSGFVGE